MDKEEFLRGLIGALGKGRVEVEEVEIPIDLMELVEKTGKSSRRSPKIDPAIDARVLKDMLPVVLRPNPFKVGDVIQLVSERSVYRFPDLKRGNGLAVVSRVFEPLSPAHRPTHTSDENTWNTNDIVVLVRAGNDEEKRWVQLIVDSWRFDKYDGDIIED